MKLREVNPGHVTCDDCGADFRGWADAGGHACTIPPTKVEIDIPPALLTFIAGEDIRVTAGSRLYVGATTGKVYADRIGADVLAKAREIARVI